MTTKTKRVLPVRALIENSPDKTLVLYLASLGTLPVGLEPISISQLKQKLADEKFIAEERVTPPPPMPLEREFLGHLKSPSWLLGLFGGKTRYLTKLHEAKEAFSLALQTYHSQFAIWQEKMQQTRESHDVEKNKGLADLNVLESSLAQGEEGAVITYCSMVLERSAHLDNKKKYVIGYDGISKVLRVAYELPAEETIPSFTPFGVESRGWRFLIERRSLFSYAVVTTAFKVLKEIFGADPHLLVDMAEFHGVDAIEDGRMPEAKKCAIRVTCSRNEYHKHLKDRAFLELSGGYYLGLRRPLTPSEIIQGYPDRTVDLLSGQCVRESLPFPWVHYPGLHGVFVGFSQEADGEVLLCDCARAAVANYFRFRKLLLEKLIYYPHIRNGDNKRSENVDADIFPSKIADQLQKSTTPDQQVKFVPELCHQCKKQTPSGLFCHEDYGGKFRSQYGWYVMQAFLSCSIFPLELGLWAANFSLYYTLAEIEVPAEIRKIIGIKDGLGLFGQDCGLDNAVENVVRSRFGFKQIGDAWVNETILFNIITTMFPSEEIRRHDRPSWLEGLELDIFLPSQQLAIEYQGIQHFQSIEAWGGQEALENVKRRDLRKAQLCRKNGIKLLYVNYDDLLTEDFVRGLILKPTRKRRSKSPVRSADG